MNEKEKLSGRADGVKAALAVFLLSVCLFTIGIGLLVSYNSALRLCALALTEASLLCLTARLFLRWNILLVLPVITLVTAPALWHQDFMQSIQKDCDYFSHCEIRQEDHFVCHDMLISAPVEKITERCVKHGYWTRNN